MPLAQRLVDGPSENFMTATEVARYFKMSIRTLQRKIENGRFPEPIEDMFGAKVWPWTDLLWYQLLPGVRSRLREPKLRDTATPICDNALPPPE
jgi:hypothetical protein